MPATDLRYAYLPFVDVRKSTAKTADGIEIPTRIVSGVMTDETLDLDGEIVDYDSAKKAATEWFRDWANVREQHSNNAIGTGIAMVTDDVKREIRTTIEVVDPLAIVKIDKGVLKGQSIGMRGGRKLVDAKAPKGRWVGFTQVEDSIVDRPANPTAKFAVTKSAKDGSMEIGEALTIDEAEIRKIAEADTDKLAAGKGTSPLIGDLVADIDGLNKEGTNPASRQTAAAPASDTGDDLDTNPGSALRRKKKQTPEIGGKPSQNAATQTPKAADKGYTPDGHGHLHTHNAGTDQEYEHDHGHDHVGGLHADGKPGDHQHDHYGKSADPDATKGSIIPGQAAANSSGEGIAEDVTSPGGATAGACPDGSCSCGGCGPSCTGDCCEACQMGDDLDRRESLHFAAGADTTKNHSEEEIEDMYAKAAPQLKTLLEAGDTQAALALLAATELVVKKATPAADAPTTEPVTDPATPVDKLAAPDALKAAISEAVTKAVDSAVKPLQEKVEELSKRAQPGAMLGGTKLFSAPKDVQAELLKDQLSNVSLEELQDLAANYPDGQIRNGFKQLLAEVTKGAATQA